MTFVLSYIPLSCIIRCVLVLSTNPFPSFCFSFFFLFHVSTTKFHFQFWLLSQERRFNFPSVSLDSDRENSQSPVRVLVTSWSSILTSLQINTLAFFFPYRTNSITFQGFADIILSIYKFYCSLFVNVTVIYICVCVYVWRLCVKIFMTWILGFMWWGHIKLSEPSLVPGHFS